MMNEHALALAHSLTTDPFPTPDYQVSHTKNEIADYLALAPDYHFSAVPILGEDTESTPDGAPYCLTFSTYPGTGRLIYATRADLLMWYRHWLAHQRPHQLLHNYLHDEVPFRQWGMPLDHFTDTMVRAYNLCLGGGGDDDEDASGAARGLLSLKVLAWRHCQMRMTSFQDTVFPHSLPHVMEWLKLAREMLAPMPVKTCVCGHARDRHIPKGKTGKTMGKCSVCGSCPGYKQFKKPKSLDDGSKELSLLHRKINTLINGLDNRALDPDSGKPINPWKRVKEWHDFDREILFESLGEIPAPSIAHVPEPELLAYACRDSDATLRLFLHMRRLSPWIFYNHHPLTR